MTHNYDNTVVIIVAHLSDDAAHLSPGWNPCKSLQIISLCVFHKCSTKGVIHNSKMTNIIFWTLYLHEYHSFKYHIYTNIIFYVSILHEYYFSKQYIWTNNILCSIQIFTIIILHWHILSEYLIINIHEYSKCTYYTRISKTYNIDIELHRSIEHYFKYCISLAPYNGLKVSHATPSDLLTRLVLWSASDVSS